MKHIIPTKEINPITYQIKDKQTILIDNLVRLDLNSKNNITIYMSNNLNIKRVYKDTNELNNLKKFDLDIEADSDIVIQGLGFIKFTNKDKVTIYVDNASVFVRKNLI